MRESEHASPQPASSQPYLPHPPQRSRGPPRGSVLTPRSLAALDVLCPHPPVCQHPHGVPWPTPIPNTSIPSPAHAQSTSRSTIPFKEGCPALAAPETTPLSDKQQRCRILPAFTPPPVSLMCSGTGMRILEGARGHLGLRMAHCGRRVPTRTWLL